MKKHLIQSIRLAIILFTVDTLGVIKISKAITYYQPEQNCVQHLLLDNSNTPNRDLQPTKAKQRNSKDEKHVVIYNDAEESKTPFKQNYWRK